MKLNFARPLQTRKGHRLIELSIKNENNKEKILYGWLMDKYGEKRYERWYANGMIFSDNCRHPFDLVNVPEPSKGGIDMSSPSLILDHENRISLLEEELEELLEKMCE